MCGHRSIFILSFLCAVILTLSACGEKPAPAPQSNAVRTKIDSRPAPKPAAKQPVQTAAAVQSADTAQPPENQAAEGSNDLVQASLAIATNYDPSGRFDPFEPLFKEESEAEPQVTDKKKTKRVPQTPLERVALSQLKVSAIIRAPSGNRALVEDATGKGYVVTNGTYMGLNSGKVVRIERDRIVVEEEIENVLGELTLKNTELKLQKPAGEL